MGDAGTVNRYVRRPPDLMFGTALLVVKKNTENESQTSRGSHQKKDHRQSWISKDSKRSLNSHQHCRADDQCSDDETESNSIRDFLKSFQNYFLVNRVDLEAQLIVSSGIEDPVYSRRQSFDELFQIDDTRQEIVWRNTLQDVALQDVVCAFADDDVGIEVRIECVDNAIQIQQSLGDHGELSRQAEPAIRRDLSDFQCYSARIQTAQDGIRIVVNKVSNSSYKRWAIKTFFLFTHSHSSFGGLLASSLADGQQQSQKIVLE